MKPKNSQEGPTTVFNIIGAGTEIKGDIVAQGDIRIDGKLIGNITTSNKLIIGKSGYIEGEVRAKIADISGQMKGKLTAGEKVIMQSTSNFTGELITDKLVIEEGAVFNGTCTMKQESSFKDKQQNKK